MNSMFSYCKKLENLDITSFNFNENLLTNIDNMFIGCSGKLKQSIRNQKLKLDKKLSKKKQSSKKKGSKKKMKKKKINKITT